MMDVTAVLSWLTLKTFLVGVMVFLLVMSYLQRRKYKLPPGPPQLPILGNYLAFRKDKRMFTVFTKMAKTHGDIFTVNLGFGQTVIVLHSADIVHEALVEKKEVFAGRDNLFWSFELLSGGYKDIVFANYGPLWTMQRRMAMKAFRTYIASDKLEQLAKSSFGEVAKMLEKQTEPVDLSEYIRLTVYNVICRMTFGKSYKVNDPEFVWLKNKMDEMMGLFTDFIPADLLPFLKHVPIKSTQVAKRTMQDLIDFQTVQVNEHKATLTPGKARDITDQLLLVRQELDAGSDGSLMETLTDKHIIQTIMDVFFAGVLTSTETLKWTMLYIADNPEIQEEMHQEISGVLADDLDDLRHSKSKLPYCEAVLREVMRMRPAAPVALGHQAIRDTKIGDYDLPKGTVVFPNLWGIHHDPRNWESPEVFKPERFLDKDGNLKPTDTKIWVPFSSGKRKCAGEGLAKADIMMIMAMFFQRFKVSFPPGQKPDFEPAMYPFDCIPKPQKLIIEKRETVC
ncbi:steroid 17-alpha-hydroxylase/17,20 lyase-like [Lingula anatina]|uniref:Steroid 17-alpha-hydroxylase/17,20 lyase-like n=1 Tax=Lingula anatina TaxID=7574 RepID=A0A1S3I3G8_LINAN|nr:steroid 17-alpha-hydroxylase/17,20 lyase-like [Lingula anatina]|eukprot:XP_013392778.1 steroid 17-alpha-hydroxylase/17,20 lyase-like [Lingula anatina]